MSKELEQEIRRLCGGLRLGPAIADGLKAFTLAEQQTIKAALTAAEKQRALVSFANAIKKAGLDPRKSLKNYEFGHFEFPKTISGQDLAMAAFIERKQNLLMLGPSGSGKTHLAMGIGIEACRQKRKVCFKTLSGLMEWLLKARDSNALAKAFAALKKLDLLIIDEWGYLALDENASHLLFRLIDEFYEDRSLIITTNLVFSEWGSVITNAKLANAIVDRLAHHSHLLHLNCESYRLRHSLMESSD